jgi:hypothetical protein
MLKLLLALLLLPAAAAEPARYQAGQVWEYHTRPGDEGSLLRIQRVEDWPGGGKVYHISVIGVRLGGIANQEIQHLPVSAATLDASVTGCRRALPSFPRRTRALRSGGRIGAACSTSRWPRS